LRNIKGIRRPFGFGYRKAVPPGAAARIPCVDVAPSADGRFAVVQVLAGYGISREYPVEKYARDALLLRIMDWTMLQLQVTKLQASAPPERAVTRELASLDIGNYFAFLRELDRCTCEHELASVKVPTLGSHILLHAPDGMHPTRPSTLQRACAEDKLRACLLEEWR
jgi:hypothetical protein